MPKGVYERTAETKLNLSLSHRGLKYPNRKQKHGHSSNPSREYRTWQHMHERCENPKHHAYKYYGGRGIKVCERWRSFENFLSDMGERPRGKTLDRFPNKNGNYEPENCRWATPREQRLNQNR